MNLNDLLKPEIIIAATGLLGTIFTFYKYLGTARKSTVELQLDEIKRLQDRMTAQEACIDALQAENREANKQQIILEHALAEARAQVEESNRTLQTTREEMARMQERLTAAQSRIERMEQDNARLTADNEQLRRENADLKSRIEDIERREAAGGLPHPASI